MRATWHTITREIDPARSVADLVQSVPGAARTFERLGIDYCCRGKRSLRDAVAETSLSLVEVVARLMLVNDPVPLIPREPGALCGYIVRHHHEFTRGALKRLAPLGDNVLVVHGRAHPELARVRELLGALAFDLEPHMAKEERVLFPYIAALAAGQRTAARFGHLERPLRVEQHDHEHVADLLREIQAQTHGYRPPPDACASFVAYYAGLKELQADLHQHMHLENNVLFPAAFALKRRLEQC